MTPSKYQQAIFDFIKNENGHLIISALAGSGKSSTLVESLKMIPEDKSVLFLAFNKSIANELKTRAPAHVDVMTLNSLGHRACMSALGRISLNDSRVIDVLNSFVDEGLMTEDDFKFQSGKIKRLVGLMKAYGLVPEDIKEKKKLFSLVDDTIEFWLSVFDEHDLSSGIEKFDLNMINLAREVLRRNINDLSSIDFSDQLYLPIIFGWKVPQYDYVFVDESQDLSAINRILVTRTIGKGSRMIACGDSLQAIYKFRGSDFNSMNEIKKVFNAKELPLSICYRCSKSVIREAQKIVPSIEYAEWAEEGSVSSITSDKAQFQAGDMIICRANAPLVAMAYQLISRKIPARIVGRDIGKGLVSLIKKMKAHSLDDLSIKVQGWKQKECRKLLSKDPTADLTKIEDKADTILHFIENSDAQDVYSLTIAIESMFSDETRGKMVVLSSVHRCVDPETFVETNNGMMKIKNITSDGQIMTVDGFMNYNTIPKIKKNNMIRISCSYGFNIGVTLDHGLNVFNKEDGNFKRKNADKICIGDILRIKIGNPENLLKLQTVNLPIPQLDHDIRTVIYKTPEKMTPDFAELLGMIVADGTVFRGGFRFVKCYKGSLDRFRDLCFDIFGYKTHRVDYGAWWAEEVGSIHLSKWISKIDGVMPNNKKISDFVLRSNAEIRSRFLKGLFEDGSINVTNGLVDHIHFDQSGSSGKEMVITIQQILLSLGIVSSIKHRQERSILYIYSQNAKKFINDIGFISLGDRISGTLSFGPELNYIVPVGKDDLNKCKEFINRRDYYNGISRCIFSRWKIGELISKIPSDVGVKWSDSLSYVYVRVTSIDKYKSESFCVEVPNGSRFLQNGFDGFNSKGLEADNVYILDSGRLLSTEDARASIGVNQEANLLYIAITRSRKNLYYM